jgi:flagellar biosynthesis/type III secretory pathway protein FliH
MRGINFDQVNDLQEIDNMLAERVKDWTRDWKEQGIREGIEEGIKQGIEKGIEQGVAQGIEKGIEQGIEKGIEQGIEQGVAQGERAVLAHLLARRFGPLDEATRQRLDAAGSAELERWADNILDAASLDAVFRAE